MAKLTIHTRVILDGKPGEVVGIRRVGIVEGPTEYEVRLDGEYDSAWFELTALLREDGKPIAVKLTRSRLIKELKLERDGYKKLISKMEEAGTDKLNSEDTESYGVYLGKFEVLVAIIKRLKLMKK